MNMSRGRKDARVNTGEFPPAAPSGGGFGKFMTIS